MGRPGLVGTMARTAVVAGTATAVVGGVQRHQAAGEQAAAQDQQNQQDKKPGQQGGESFTDQPNKRGGTSVDRDRNGPMDK